LANISDIIEQFILETMGKSSSLSFSRNDLANHFSCVPSQINYVLSTRFQANRGFIIESQRGGGGYIKIIKLNLSKTNNLVKYLIELIGDEISYKDALGVLNMLVEENIVSQQEKQSVQILLSDKSLANPFKLQSYLRANMLKELIYNQIKES
jgi:transcriptional regulator CtsR